jgi:FkbM family methyltransferase
MVEVSWQTALFGAVAVVGLLFALIAAYVVSELSKEPPRGGTPFTLPNGMRIQHWQRSETEFLYNEIFGSESAYGDRDAANRIRFEPGATIVDAGANIGMFTLFAAQQCRGDAHIYSFEPIPTTFSVLRANAEAANRGDFATQFKPAAGARLSITPLNMGLSDARADVTFEHHPHFSVWSTQDAAFARTRLQRIKDDMPRATA